jgi:carboxymethylenebutenolidase
MGDIHLTRPGGRFMAYFARAEATTGAGVVIYHDGYGYRDFYKEVARHFASAGVDAVAIDLYSRSAADGDGPRDENWAFRPHMEQVTPETVAADTHAAVDYLRSKDGGSVRSVFTLGFCFSAGLSWLQSAGSDNVAGCIGMYGHPARPREVIDRLRAPLLIIVAGADRTPREEFDRFDSELSAADVPHRMVVYDGAPHSFFDVKFADWKDACDDAWRQMLDFIREPVPA